MSLRICCTNLIAGHFRLSAIQMVFRLRVESGTLLDAYCECTALLLFHVLLDMIL